MPTRIPSKTVVLNSQYDQYTHEYIFCKEIKICDLWKILMLKKLQTFDSEKINVLEKWDIFEDSPTLCGRDLFS